MKLVSLSGESQIETMKKGFQAGEFRLCRRGWEHGVGSHDRCVSSRSKPSSGARSGVSN